MHDSPVLKSVLDAFHRFLIPCEFEILVVANLENPKIMELVKNYPRGRYLCAGILGVNHARNFGLKEAQYKYSYFLDSDCLVNDPEFFVSLHKELVGLKNDKCFVGGPYRLSLNFNLFDQSYFQIQKKWLASGILDSDNCSAFLLGGNFGGLTQELHKHLFDPQIVFGGSETEFFLRLHRIGYICHFRPQLAIQHMTSMSLKSLLSKAYKQGRGAAYIQAKSLGFKSQYLQAEEPLPPQVSVRFWISVYYVFFQYSLLWHLPLKDKWQFLCAKLKSWLIAPELARKNLVSRLVALIGLHLNSKK